MILDTDIHNFYEHLVLKEIERQGLNQKLSANQMADLCCLTLNQLPSHYIRHDVDMIYFLTDAKRTEMEKTSSSRSSWRKRRCKAPRPLRHNQGCCQIRAATPVIPATGSRISAGLSLGSSMTQAASKKPRLHIPYALS